MNYATGTQVTERESRAEIEALLKGTGCAWVKVGCNAAGHAVARFVAHGREIRIMVRLPDEGSRDRPRRWRVLLLLLKAKLEAVESGITTFDEEFLAHVTMDDGKSAGQFMASHLPQLVERTA